MAEVHADADADPGRKGVLLLFLLSLFLLLSSVLRWRRHRRHRYHNNFIIFCWFCVGVAIAVTVIIITL